MSPARRAATAAAVLLVVGFAVFGLARAAAPPPLSQSEQAAAISQTIRCPTCQGLSIQDSPSVLASGSRQIVEEQVAQGRTPEEIRQYFVDRYGEFVLLSPRSTGPGVLAWLVPLLALPLAGLLVWRWVRQRRAAAADVAARSDGDAPQAASSLADYRAGRLDPDASPAGERLREALVVRAGLDDDEVADAAATGVADLRLAVASRRYRARSTDRARGTAAPSRPLPRRAVAAGTACLLVVGVVASLAVGVRGREAGDLPTGDLPGSVVAQSGPQLTELLAATRDRPQDAGAWAELGRTYEALEQFAPAVSAYDQSLRLGAGDDVALLRAGVLVLAGSPSEALPVLQDLQTRRPDDPDTLLLLGLSQRATQAPEASSTLRRFLELAPASPAAAGVRDMLAEP